MSDYRKMVNKSIAREVHKILRRNNREAKLAEAYEMLSRAHGFRNWNTASASGVVFEEGDIERIIEAFIDPNIEEV